MVTLTYGLLGSLVADVSDVAYGWKRPEAIEVEATVSKGGLAKRLQLLRLASFYDPSKLNPDVDIAWSSSPLKVFRPEPFPELQRYVCAFPGLFFVSAA